MNGTCTSSSATTRSVNNNNAHQGKQHQENNNIVVEMKTKTKEECPFKKLHDQQLQLRHQQKGPSGDNDDDNVDEDIGSLTTVGSSSNKLKILSLTANENHPNAYEKEELELLLNSLFQPVSTLGSPSCNEAIAKSMEIIEGFDSSTIGSNEQQQLLSLEDADDDGDDDDEGESRNSLLYHAYEYCDSRQQQRHQQIEEDLSVTVAVTETEHTSAYGDDDDDDGDSGICCDEQNNDNETAHHHVDKNFSVTTSNNKGDATATSSHSNNEYVIPTTKNKIMARYPSSSCTKNNKIPSSGNTSIKSNNSGHKRLNNWSTSGPSDDGSLLSTNSSGFFSTTAEDGTTITGMKRCGGGDGSSSDTNSYDEEYGIEKKLFLLDTIASVQRQYLQSEGPRATFNCLLEALLDIMESEYGFIGEVKYETVDTFDINGGDDDGSNDGTDSHHQNEPEQKMYLQTHAITNIAWNSVTRKFYDDNIESGLKFYNMETLFGHVMTTSSPIISNTPSSDPRGAGIPKGHPSLDSFLGIPFFKKENEINGMVGIANKPGGYKQADIDFLEPFIITCGNLIHAYHNLQQNKELINNLEQKVKERTLELEKLNKTLADANRRISISAKTERELLTKNLRQSDELLVNMLPPEIATRLKNDPSHLADSHDNVTILFADLCGFTEMSSAMSPTTLVKFLNDLFSKFDKLVKYYELNKVKTIGDCYMVTSIPKPSSGKDDLQACIDTCHLAFDMLETLQNFNRQYHPDKKLEIRIGMNVGPVVAGVIGTSRFLYDLWGDTVNVASRMESSGIPSQIQVTEQLKNYIKKSAGVNNIEGNDDNNQNFMITNEFGFKCRGEIDVKGKGLMKTYWLQERNYNCDSIHESNSSDSGEDDEE